MAVIKRHACRVDLLCQVAQPRIINEIDERFFQVKTDHPVSGKLVQFPLTIHFQ